MILFFWLVAEKVKECERNVEFWVFCWNCLMICLCVCKDMIGGVLGIDS